MSSVTDAATREWRRSSLFLLTAMILLPTSARTQDISTPQRISLPRLLSASGTGEVRVKPDMAEVRLGVQTEATTATNARQQNAQRAQAVVDAIHKLGIPADSIQTSTFDISPVRRSDNPQYSGEPPIVGYSVTNTVSVRTGNLDLVPRVIDESITAGANRVDSVNFVLRDDAASRRAALRAAIADAVSNARVMAKELGVRLVRVYNVQQGGAGVTPPPIMYRSVAAESMAPTPILPGQVTVNASASVTYVIQ